MSRVGETDENGGICVIDFYDIADRIVKDVTTRICNQLMSVNELKEIREEIAQIKATQLYSTIDLKDMVLAIIDKHMEEHHD